MAIRTVITRGFGNGTFNGTIALVATRGYSIGAVVIFDPLGFLVRVPPRSFQVEVKPRTFDVAVAKRTFQVEVKPGGRRTP